MSVDVQPTETLESQTLYNKALEMISRKQLKPAISFLEEAMQISPDNSEYLSHYAWCLAMDRKDFESAVRLCERAIRIEPKNPVNQVILGRIHRLRGENGEAYGAFLEAWKQDKTHPMAASELSRMGIRRPPVLTFLDRSHPVNVKLGKLRARLERAR